ncbi:hypothetical protein BDP27DRAFT_1507793 [Rhodocollybia butyracea]|uniref:Uncharacterized protein n=1 Tax=Rhodocollybia butyracea TaxID=206335 RepID=A0A9P5TXN5_9AGAR|nr:hypothetical protein BDP27DRAFT_1507793 [Rhodocollybia butyracea]
MPPLTPRKRLHEPEPASTPIHNRATTMHGAMSSHYVLDRAHRVAEKEMRDKYEKIDMRNLLDLLPEAEDESGNAAITAMKDYLSPEWVFINTSNHCDASSFSAKYFSFSAIKPDIGLYKASKYNPDSTTNSASAELFGEFKVKKHDDPFPPADPPPESCAAKDEVICKKLKIGAEYEQFVTTRTEYYDIDSKEDSKEASGHAARKGEYQMLAPAFGEAQIPRDNNDLDG